MYTYYIYLHCYEASGYFTGISISLNGREVCVHPSKLKAYKFKDKDKAYAQAKALKNSFSCIKSYEIKS